MLSFSLGFIMPLTNANASWSLGLNASASLNTRHEKRFVAILCFLLNTALSVFNEAEAFNPRDQLAFAFVRDMMNPKLKLNMFDVEVFEQVTVEYRHNLKGGGGGASGPQTKVANSYWLDSKPSSGKCGSLFMLINDPLEELVKVLGNRLHPSCQSLNIKLTKIRKIIPKIRNTCQMKYFLNHSLKPVLTNVTILVLLPKHHPTAHVCAHGRNLGTQINSLSFPSRLLERFYEKTQLLSSHGLKRIDLDVAKELQSAQLSHGGLDAKLRSCVLRNCSAARGDETMILSTKPKRKCMIGPWILASFYVPDSAVIIRKHSTATNLFSCLVFNEAEAFNPRDQLAFAFVRDMMNPKLKLNMFDFEVFEQVTVEYRHNHEAGSGGASGKLEEHQGEGEEHNGVDNARTELLGIEEEGKEGIKRQLARVHKSEWHEDWKPCGLQSCNKPFALATLVIVHLAKQN
nr:uncharacterized protein LOC109188594 [Ipomoea batatas]